MLGDRYSKEYEIERLCRDAPLLLIGERTPLQCACER
jgi:hypothetical protein